MEKRMKSDNQLSLLIHLSISRGQKEVYFELRENSNNSIGAGRGVRNQNLISHLPNLVTT
jgi:hypothetical protein